MPAILLERAPLPTLKVYTCVSVAALSACVYFAAQSGGRDPNWNGGDAHGAAVPHDANKTNSSGLDERSFGSWVYHVFSMMVREPVSVWVSDITNKFDGCGTTRARTWARRTSRRAITLMSPTFPVPLAPSCFSPLFCAHPGITSLVSRTRLTSRFKRRSLQCLVKSRHFYSFHAVKLLTVQIIY